MPTQRPDPIADTAPRLPLWGGLTFVMLGLVVTLLWSNWAETESRRNFRSEHSYNSIVALVRGDAPAPFVYRRLYPDAIAVIVRVVPAPAWNVIVDRMQHTWLRRIVVDQFKWRVPEDYPILVAGTFLLWLSVSGFMFAAYGILMHQYRLSPQTATLLAMVLGVGVLGAGGGYSYQWYPYDFVIVFASTACILTMITRSWWFIPAFLAVAYAKETSVLLLIAFWLVDDRKSVTQKLAVSGLLLAVFGVFQLAARWRFPDVLTPPFWWPGRNAAWLGWESVFDSWLWMFVLVGVWQIVAMRSQWPRDLRRLMLLAPLFIVAAFFKGWLEERRQYFDLYAVAGMLFLQWVDVTVGFNVMKPRRTS